jgi:hypothetical protein
MRRLRLELPTNYTIKKGHFIYLGVCLNNFFSAKKYIQKGMTLSEIITHRALFHPTHPTGSFPTQSQPRFRATFPPQSDFNRLFPIPILIT